jgi:hypothetical protein
MSAPEITTATVSILSLLASQLATSGTYSPAPSPALNLSLRPLLIVSPLLSLPCPQSQRPSSKALLDRKDNLKRTNNPHLPLQRKRPKRGIYIHPSATRTHSGFGRRDILLCFGVGEFDSRISAGGGAIISFVFLGWSFVVVATVEKEGGVEGLLTLILVSRLLETRLEARLS